ncbi:hypothetical protein VP01_135g10 [Puccinia sorghi]|uniref:Glycosylphosphatidylinositol anchor biosynthesis protein 11 n=1 Tax=Puccinia sorghi TaxID=27349 RepID=A0A0L6VM41_9BASI|nr:hypothetical protein VP01_135g10 [Puccinia sorghi]
MSKTTRMEETRGANLRTKYYSIVPLQVLFMHFSVYYLPAKMLAKEGDDESGGDASAAAGWTRTMRLDHLVHRPIASLLVINLATLLVQLWFANFLRAWKAALSAPLTDTTTTNKYNNKEVGPRTGKLGLAKLKTLLFLRPDQIVTSLVSEPAVERGWLVSRGGRFVSQKVERKTDGWAVGGERGVHDQRGDGSGDDGCVGIAGSAGGESGGTAEDAGTGMVRGAGDAVPGLASRRLEPRPLCRQMASHLLRLPVKSPFSLSLPLPPLSYVPTIALLFPACGAALGAWLGAIPIPLDWDRPWQAWPITCLLAASTGNAIGHFVAVLTCLRSSS